MIFSPGPGRCDPLCPVAVDGCGIACATGSTSSSVVVRTRPRSPDSYGSCGRQQGSSPPGSRRAAMPCFGYRGRWPPERPRRHLPFLHAACATIQATLRTSRREEIRAFARLLRAGRVDPPRIDLETEQEDYLKILDDLSVRDLQIPWLLGEIENRYPYHDDEYAKDTDWFDSHWSEFEDAVASTIGTPRAELPGLLARLGRTGLYEPLSTATWGGPAVSMGRLTGAYKRFATLIGDDPRMFDSGAVVPQAASKKSLRSAMS